MADEGIFATTTEIQRKAGDEADSTATAEAYTNDFISQAESLINCICRYNFSDEYASLNADVKGILKMAASNIAAIYCINYNYNLFSSRTNAENQVNVLRDFYLLCISLLKKKETQRFIKDA